MNNTTTTPKTHAVTTDEQHSPIVLSARSHEVCSDKFNVRSFLNKFFSTRRRLSEADCFTPPPRIYVKNVETIQKCIDLNLNFVIVDNHHIFNELNRLQKKHTTRLEKRLRCKMNDEHDHEDTPRAADVAFGINIDALKRASTKIIDHEMKILKCQKRRRKVFYKHECFLIFVNKYVKNNTIAAIIRVFFIDRRIVVFFI